MVVAVVVVAGLDEYATGLVETAFAVVVAGLDEYATGLVESAFAEEARAEEATAEEATAEEAVDRAKGEDFKAKPWVTIVAGLDE